MWTARLPPFASLACWSSLLLDPLLIDITQNNLTMKLAVAALCATSAAAFAPQQGNQAFRCVPPQWHVMCRLLSWKEHGRKGERRALRCLPNKCSMGSKAKLDVMAYAICQEIKDFGWIHETLSWMPCCLLAEIGVKICSTCAISVEFGYRGILESVGSTTR